MHILYPANRHHLVKKRDFLSTRQVSQLKIARVIAFLSLFLPLLVEGAYALEEGLAATTTEPKSVENRPQGESPGEKLVLQSGDEVEKNKKLLQRAIRDLDSFRLTFKNIRVHKDYGSRILLAEEANKYIDKYVDPLIDAPLMNVPETVDMVMYLEFFKAYLYFEAGEYGRYSATIKKMREKYGREHLGVSIGPFNAEFETIGEGIIRLDGKLPEAGP